MLKKAWKRGVSLRWIIIRPTCWVGTYAEKGWRQKEERDGSDFPHRGALLSRVLGDGSGGCGLSLIGRVEALNLRCFQLRIKVGTEGVEKPTRLILMLTRFL